MGCRLGTVEVRNEERDRRGLDDSPSSQAAGAGRSFRSAREPRLTHRWQAGLTPGGADAGGMERGGAQRQAPVGVHRGENRAPVLLFLHGGPGASESRSVAATCVTLSVTGRCRLGPARRRPILPRERNVGEPFPRLTSQRRCGTCGTRSPDYGNRSCSRSCCWWWARLRPAADRPGSRDRRPQQLLSRPPRSGRRPPSAGTDVAGCWASALLATWGCCRAPSYCAPTGVWRTPAWWPD